MTIYKNTTLFVCAFLIFASLAVLTAKSIDIDEIKTNQQIEFQNYEGRHSKSDSWWGIRAIGRKLATGRVDKDRTVRYHFKYSIIHAQDDTTGDLLDADIFVIDPDGQVDHIRNVRLIIASYLEKRFRYSRKDATLLARFLTVYNAVYRGNISYATTRYKPIVLKYLTDENMGISKKYYEWPGKTRILIPLTDRAQKGEISSLDTTEFTDENVIETMREDDDKSIKEREEMTEFKEREVEEQKKEIEDDKKQLEKEKKEIEKDEKDLESITESDKREEKEKEIAEKKENIADKEEDIEKKEKDVTEKEKEIIKDKEEIKKDDVPDKERDELVKKENELDEREKELKTIEDRLKSNDTDDKIFGNKLYYLKINDFMSSGHYNNSMHMINPDSRRVIITSPLNKICGNRYDVFSSGVVVISYEGSHSSDHFLVLLDLENLQVKEKGTNNIMYRSFIEVNDGFIYAIVKDGKKHYLAKFNDRLTRVAQSEEQVSDNTFITFYKNQIFINSVNKTIIAINKTNLSLIGTIEP